MRELCMLFLIKISLLQLDLKVSRTLIKFPQHPLISIKYEPPCPISQFHPTYNNNKPFKLNANWSIIQWSNDTAVFSQACDIPI